nr:MAG TPA: hypothetical protein [Microviridae sp.]
MPQALPPRTLNLFILFLRLGIRSRTLPLEEVINNTLSTLQTIKLVDPGKRVRIEVQRWVIILAFPEIRVRRLDIRTARQNIYSTGTFQNRHNPLATRPVFRKVFNHIHQHIND